LLVLALLAGGARAQGPPPAVQQGALPVGVYQITASAAPTELQEGEQLTLTLRVTATSPKSEEPRRPDLRSLVAPPRKLDDDFYLELPADAAPWRPEPNVWEFKYLLRPKRTGVKSIPALKFQYTAVRGGKTQNTFTRDTIELTVRPRKQAELPPPGKILAPAGAFEAATGDTVLRRDGPSWWFEPWALALLALAPPLGCAAWYGVWCWRHPDAARLRRRLHARATRRAIRELKRAGEPGGAATAAALTRYLRQRFDLAVTEPTPAEVAKCLQRAGASAAVVQKATGLLSACDGARFAPAGARAGLAADAIQFIQTLEADLCAARPS
jgi:hypothetical protein